MKILKKIILGVLILLFLSNLLFIVALFGAPCGRMSEDLKLSISIGVCLLLLIALINKIIK